MNRRNKDEFEDKVSSWSERIGASIIGVLTVLGVGLITYTGVKAVTFETPKVEQEYLTLEDTEVTPDVAPEANEQDQSVTNTTTEENVTQEEVTQPETPVEETQPEIPQSEQPVVEVPQTVEATCNIDGVNVREEQKTGTTIIGQLISGEKITVLNRNYSDEWVQVSYDGQTGYVYHEYLDFN